MKKTGKDLYFKIIGMEIKDNDLTHYDKALIYLYNYLIPEDIDSIRKEADSVLTQTQNLVADLEKTLKDLNKKQ